MSGILQYVRCVKYFEAFILNKFFYEYSSNHLMTPVSRLFFEGAMQPRSPKKQCAPALSGY